MKKKLYQISVYFYGIFYLIAGANHFINKDLYLGIMPNYLPAPLFLVYLSGIAEIILGILFLWPKTRNLAVIFIIFMLLAFLPIHLYMVQIAPFKLGKLHVSLWIAWLRIPLQFLLIAITWCYYNKKRQTLKPA